MRQGERPIAATLLGEVPAHEAKTKPPGFKSKEGVPNQKHAQYVIRTAGDAALLSDAKDGV